MGHSNCRSVLCHSHIKLQKLGEERSLIVKGVALGSGSCRFCLTRLHYCNALFPITHEIIKLLDGKFWSAGSVSANSTLKF